MDRNRWIIFAAIVILAVSALLLFSKSDNIDVSNVDANKAVTEGQYKDHIYGNTSGKVTLIEYGDFQCPACASAYPNVKAVKEKYKEQLTFVFRNFPLTSIHPNALAAATVAEAASMQGKFWEMHDMLYENQTAWQNADSNNRGGIFEGYARELGLNIDQYKADLTKPEISQKIKFDQALGRKAGANSTPTFVLNGRTLSNDKWNSAEAFDKTVSGELKKAGFTLE